MNYSSREIDKNKYAQAIEYIRNSAKYSLEKLIHDKKLDEGMKMQGENHFISCPFHSDSSPSFSINFEKNVYRCFGCSSRGGYVELLHDLENFYGRLSTKPQIVNRLLREDALMRNSLGFVTIDKPKEQKLDVENLSIRRRKERALSRYKPDNFISIANKMNKDKKTVTEKVYMIALMQSGMSAKDVYSAVYEDIKGTHSTNEVVEGIDLSSILGDDN